MLGVVDRGRDRRLRADAHGDLDDRRRRGAFGLGAITARTVTDHGLAHRSARGRACCSLGFLLAVVGGLLAGAAGAFRAARLRPADALRTVE